ncbi:MAG: hypothetical protein ACHQAX_01990 [Gammaproteobacteria bacterium]
MAVNVKANEFSKQRMINIMAVFAWMKDANDNANIRYAAFSTTNNAVEYQEPNTGFFDDKSNRLDKEAKTRSEDPSTNAPNINELLDMMLFIEAVNAEDVRFQGGVPTAAADFVNFAKKPFQAELDLLKPSVPVDAEADKKNRRQLANEMLDTLTRYRERGFMTMEEQISSGKVLAEDKQAYQMFSALHAHALNRVASGSPFIEPGGSPVSRGLGILGRSILVLPLYPLFMAIGGSVSLIVNGYNFVVGKKTTDWDYTSRWFSVMSGLTYPMGDAGSKYWAQARLNMPKMLPWDSVGHVVHNVIHNPLAILSIGLTIIPEFIGKTLVWPLKLIVGYDRLPTDSPVRQAINGLENSIVGILASPVIVFNHFYRAVLDWGDKTFSPPEKDQGLLAAEKWLADNLPTFKVNISNPKAERDAGDYIFIGFYKFFRFIFDTIPSILTNTIIGSLRSILPAMPGTTKENRDKAFNALWYAVYAATFVLTGTFLASVFLAGIGVTVPGWMAGMVGASAGDSATAIATAYGSQIWGVITTIGHGFVSSVVQPALSFMLAHANPAVLFTAEGLPAIAAKGIAAGFAKIGSTAAIVGTVIGSVLGTGLAIFTGVKLWKVSKEKGVAANARERLIVNSDPRKEVLKKVSVPDGVLAHAPGSSKLLLQHPRDALSGALRAKVEANKQSDTKQSIEMQSTKRKD